MNKLSNFMSFVNYVVKWIKSVLLELQYYCAFSHEIRQVIILHQTYSIHSLLISIEDKSIKKQQKQTFMKLAHMSNECFKYLLKNRFLKKKIFALVIYKKFLKSCIGLFSTWYSRDKKVGDAQPLFNCHLWCLKM